jgi:secondary thiamine-phosphate synthase enzyme
MDNRILKIETKKTFTDITEEVKNIVEESGIYEGILYLSSMHTTCGIKIMENEILSLYDIDLMIKKIIPDNKYAHDQIHLRQVPIDERTNAVSHLRMLFFDSCLFIPIINSKIVLGDWQRIMVVEMDDNIPFRNRRISICIKT